MGLILAGILVGALLIGLLFLLEKLGLDTESIGGTVILLAILFVVVGFILGIVAPVSGYGEPEIVSTIELVSLKDETITEGRGGWFYVSISGVNSYTYRFEIDSPYATDTAKAYDSDMIIDGTDGVVITVEDDSYTDAKLVTYVRKGRMSFWTFAVGAKEYEYVFYVPTGTIARDVSLG